MQTLVLEVSDDIYSHSRLRRLVRVAALLRRYSASPQPLLRLHSHVPALSSIDLSLNFEKVLVRARF